MQRFWLKSIEHVHHFCEVCYCSSVLSCSNPYDFGGLAGTVMVSGADSTQVQS